MMRLHPLIVMEFLRGLGVPGALGGVLLGFALVYALAGVLPASQERAAVQERVDRAQARVAAIQEGGVLPPESPARQLEDFHQALPPQGEATAAIDRLFEAAARQGLSLARGEYALLVDADTGMARYQMVMPVRASYPQLRRFLDAVLDEVPSIGLEHLELERKQIAEAELEGPIRMTLYLTRR